MTKKAVLAPVMEEKSVQRSFLQSASQPGGALLTNRIFRHFAFKHFANIRNTYFKVSHKAAYIIGTTANLVEGQV